MKNFRISSWTTVAERPDETFVIAVVLTDLNGIEKRDSYEFWIDGKYDSITDEFTEAVKQKLLDAGLL